jgi:hypothetical protein
LNNADKYTSGWDASKNSETGTKEAMQSPEISNTGFALKFYPTKGGMQNAMGLVKSNTIAHYVEAGMELIERKIFGSKADKDPISDMHYGNAKSFLNSINQKHKNTTPSWTIPLYYRTGGMR